MQICVCAVRKFDLKARSGLFGLLAVRFGRVGTDGDGSRCFLVSYHAASFIIFSGFLPAIFAWKGALPASRALQIVSLFLKLTSEQRYPRSESPASYR